MSKVEEMKVRVRRLMTGQNDPDDFYKLLLWLREKKVPHPALVEVANFVAHGDNRDQGLAVGEALAALRSIRHVQPRLTSNVHVEDLPADTFDVAATNLRRLPQKALRKDVHLTLKAALQALEAGKAKYRVGPAGRFRLGGQLTEDEYNAISYGSSVIITKACFTLAELFRQFGLGLRGCDLIAPSEANKLLPSYAGLGLFAVQAMHHTTLRLEDGWEARLFCIVRDGKIWIYASASIATSVANWSVPILETGLPAVKYLSADLITETDLGGVHLKMLPDGPLLARL